jgi:large subunit ribosomal protein L21
MLSRVAKRTVLDIRGSLILPSIPHQLRLISSTTPTIEDAPIQPVLENPVKGCESSASPVTDEPFTSKGSGLGSSLTPTQQPSHTPLDDSIRTLLPLLKAQGPHYITSLIHARPYLLTTGDTLRLPFQMPGVSPGDVLRLNRASNIGSRDFTLKGTPYVDERFFECRARVMGVEAEPMRIKEKTKRRQRRVKTVRSKHRFTVLKISELRINMPEGMET